MEIGRQHCADSAPSSSEQSSMNQARASDEMDASEMPYSSTSQSTDFSTSSSSSSSTASNKRISIEADNDDHDVGVKRQKSEPQGEHVDAQMLDSVMKSVMEGDLVAAFGLKPGSRIEVLWTLEDDSQGTSDTETIAQEHWWPATLEKPSGKKHILDDPASPSKDSLAVAIYTIRYDAMPPNFPDETVSYVCFTDEHQLYDIEHDGLLLWRRFGSDWTVLSVPETPKNEILGALRACEKEGDPTLLQNLVSKGLSAIRERDSIPVPEGKTRQASEALVNVILGNVIEANKRLMSRLPATQQYSMADKVCEVREKLIEKITHCLDTKKILDMESVKEIIDEVKAEGLE